MSEARNAGAETALGPKMQVGGVDLQGVEQPAPQGTETDVLAALHLRIGELERLVTHLFDTFGVRRPE